MSGIPIDGRPLARELLDAVRSRVESLRGPAGIATLLIGDDAAAGIYQRRIHAAAGEVGLHSRVERLPGDASLRRVARTLAELDADQCVSGILILRPIPPHLPEPLVLRSIPPERDVEAQHPENAGLLALGTPRFVPSTAGAAFALLDRHMEERGRSPRLAYDGIDLVIVGRSNNVGKPAAILGSSKRATPRSSRATSTPRTRIVSPSTRGSPTS